MKKIALSNGLYSLVDDDMFEGLNQFKWCVGNTVQQKPYYEKRWYPMRTAVVDGRRHTVYMHREIMRAQPRQIVDHVDNDTLDNRRENLRFVTPSENGKNRRKKR